MTAVAHPRTTYRYRSVEGCDIHADVIGAVRFIGRGCNGIVA